MKEALTDALLDALELAMWVLSTVGLAVVFGALWLAADYLGIYNGGLGPWGL